MSAGASAAQQAQRLGQLAESHRRAAAQSTTEAARYAAAAAAERRLARRLAPLTVLGYHLLADRRWPGSRTAQLDLIVVGPSGVWIVDSKRWNDFQIAAGHVFRGQDDVTDEILRLADVANDAEDAFAAVGLAPGEVRPLVVMDGHRGRLGDIHTVEVVGEADVHKHIAGRGARLTAPEVEKVLAVALDYFPAYVGPRETDAAPAIVPEPVLPVPEIFDDPVALTDDEVVEALTQAQLAAPVEDWMTFLHPVQARLVRRSFNGPARIRGAAGTGKTVVGLHRAAYLARTHPNARVLFTTYVRSLPEVMKSLLHRLEPAVHDRVEFISVHRFATRVLNERGIRFRLANDKQQWNIAWATLPAEYRDRLMERARSRSSDYWREEVQYVIKGRGLTTYDTYAVCSRHGRTLPLNSEDRRAVWMLYIAYQRALQNAGLIDYDDLINLAERALRERPAEGYSAVIVDEAQDLSLSMVRMLHSIVGDAPDGFTLIGDGHQSIYPGGYQLAEANISLAGRGVVLDVNYRNTAEIQRYAEAMIADTAVVDIDDEAPAAGDAAATATASTEAMRRGPEPSEYEFASVAEHDLALVLAVKGAANWPGVGLGDIAVLCETNKQADRAQWLLTEAGLESINLLAYTGQTVEKVKVGTVKRAKGLEFKVVLLPWSPMPSAQASHEERAARQRRERYVAATRARDLLWVGRVTN